MFVEEFSLPLRWNSAQGDLDGLEIFCLEMGTTTKKKIAETRLIITIHKQGISNLRILKKIRFLFVAQINRGKRNQKVCGDEF